MFLVTTLTHFLVVLFVFCVSPSFDGVAWWCFWDSFDWWRFWDSFTWWCFWDFFTWWWLGSPYGRVTNFISPSISFWIWLLFFWLLIFVWVFLVRDGVFGATIFFWSWLLVSFLIIFVLLGFHFFIFLWLWFRLRVFLCRNFWFIIF